MKIFSQTTIRTTKTLTARQSGEPFFILAPQKSPNKKGKQIREAGWHNEIILEEDIDVFTSPSGASDFVSSYSTNGWLEWKTEDGETLDDIVAKDLEKSYAQIADE